jgi:predicted GIY-YIG superfamily endonuclease
MTKEYTLYLVSLGRDNAYKIGITKDLEKRLSSHRRANPWVELIVSAGIESEKEARRDENFLVDLFHDYKFDYRGFDHEGREIFTLDPEALERLVMHISHMIDPDEIDGIP